MEDRRLLENHPRLRGATFLAGRVNTLLIYDP